MVAVVAAPVPILQFLDNAGNPAVGGSVLTQVGGVNYVTYSDSGGATSLPNPIPLNARGEISTAVGASSQLFVVPNMVYTFTLFDAKGNQLWSAPYVNGAQITTLPNTSIPIAQTAAEIAAGSVPINLYLAPGIWDRYGTNTIPGTTPMSAAVQASINQMLQPGGAPSQGLPGVYLLDAGTPTFGTYSGNPICGSFSGAPNYGTQLINGAAAGASACIDLTGAVGMRVRDLVVTCSSANKNDGVRIGTAASGLTTVDITVERVWCLVAGHGFVLADTNTVNIIDCNSWSNGNNLMQITPAVTATDILTHLYMTGSFIIDIRIRRFQGWPGTGYASGMKGIDADALDIFNVSIDTALVQGSGGANSLTAMSFGGASSNSVIGCTIANVYHENAMLAFNNLQASFVYGITNGAVGGGLAFNHNCRGNLIAALGQPGSASGTLSFDASSYGNTIIGGYLGGAITDSASPPNLFMNPSIAGVGWGPYTQGGLIYQVVPYSASMAPNAQLGKYMDIDITNNTAAAIALPTGLIKGDSFKIRIRAVGATPGTVTFGTGFKMPSLTPTMPASGFNRTFAFDYDGSVACIVIVPGVDVPN